MITKNFFLHLAIMQIKEQKAIKQQEARKLKLKPPHQN